MATAAGSTFKAIVPHNLLKFRELWERSLASPPCKTEKQCQPCSPLHARKLTSPLT